MYRNYNKNISKNFVVVVLVCYLTTVMYYVYGQRSSPSLDRWYMVWMIYNGHMITGDECGPNSLTFVSRLRGKPRKILNQEIDSIGDRTRARCMRSNDVTPRPQRWSLKTLRQHSPRLDNVNVLYEHRFGHALFYFHGLFSTALSLKFGGNTNFTPSDDTT